MTTTTKPPALVGWRKLVAFTLALSSIVGLALLGRLTVESSAGIAALLGVYVGGNAANARARAKGDCDGRTA